MANEIQGNHLPIDTLHAPPLSKWQKFRDWTRRIEWKVGLFLIFNPLVSTSLLIYLSHTGAFSFTLRWETLVFALILGAATNLSITAGYHRLFSHKSYEVHPFVRWIYLAIGAGAFQGSAMKWSSDHRVHHRFEDTDGDPYNINRGFWYAHMGWLFLKSAVDLPVNAPDLAKDRVVLNQHRYYVLWAIASGYLVPALIGLLWNDPIGAFIIAGGLRIALTQQSTFLINSLCHVLGKQTYSKEITARDSWIVALLTHGEGYHNFHHKFQYDYRNAILWYQWDPTKWLINGLAWMGLAGKLRTAQSSEILKARLLAESQTLCKSGFSNEKIEELRAKILSAQLQWRKLNNEYNALKAQYKVASAERIERMRQDLRRDILQAKAEFKAGLREWKILLSA